MKTRFIKSLAVFSLTIGLFSSCVEDDSTMEDAATGIVTYEMTANKTLQDIVAFNNTATPVQYTANDIVEAYVTSSDETGTFYNSISLQNIGTNTTQPVGASVAVNLSYYSKGFTPGRKIYIKMQGLYTAIVDGSLKIGDLFEGAVGRISENEWQNHLFPSTTIVPEDNMVRTLTLAQAANNVNLNTLIEINNVQFADSSLGRTYFDIDSGGSATNHNIVDVNGGTTRYFRVSEFALFASQTVPTGRGKIRGVMTKFGSDFQFLVRHQNDVKLTDPRTYTFFSTLNENFQSYAINQSGFVNYLNFYETGSKLWLVKSVNSSQCIQMSSFGGDLENNKAYFVVPVNFAAANTLTFSVDADFFSTGLGLKVYRSTDYAPGKKMSESTLYDITSHFTLPTANTTTFVSAGTYTFPTALTDNGYVIFEYTGSNISGPNLQTTNCNIDNIVIN